MTLRTFLALDIDASVRRRLSSVGKGAAAVEGKIRWVAARNLHVTLNFLGEVEPARLQDVCTAAADAAEHVPPFEFRIRGLQAVPPHGRPRMIWACATDPTGEMAALRARLTEALGGLGFRSERRLLRPHVTLARIKFMPAGEALRAAVAGLADRDFGPTGATELVAYTSDLTPSGPVYAPAARVRLGG